MFKEILFTKLIDGGGGFASVFEDWMIFCGKKVSWMTLLFPPKQPPKRPKMRCQAGEGNLKQRKIIPTEETTFFGVALGMFFFFLKISFITVVHRQFVQGVVGLKGTSCRVEKQLSLELIKSAAYPRIIDTIFIRIHLRWWGRWIDRHRNNNSRRRRKRPRGRRHRTVGFGYW
jgi:hypothetical protein